MLPASFSCRWGQGEAGGGEPLPPRPLRPLRAGTHPGRVLMWSLGLVAAPPGRGGEAHFLVVGHGWEFGGGRLVIMEDLEMANLLLVL